MRMLARRKPVLSSSRQGIDMHGKVGLGEDASGGGGGGECHQEGKEVDFMQLVGQGEEVVHQGEQEVMHQGQQEALEDGLDGGETGALDGKMEELQVGGGDK